MTLTTWKNQSFLTEKINQNPGGQFAPKLGGQFTPNLVVNLLRIWVVNLTVFSNKELTEGEFELLKPNISRAYIIRNISTDASNFVESEPENLFNTYNELYAN